MKSVFYGRRMEEYLGIHSFFMHDYMNQIKYYSKTAAMDDCYILALKRMKNDNYLSGFIDIFLRVIDEEYLIAEMKLMSDLQVGDTITIGEDVGKITKKHYDFNANIVKYQTNITIHTDSGKKTIEDYGEDEIKMLKDKVEYLLRNEGCDVASLQERKEERKTIEKAKEDKKKGFISRLFKNIDK